MLVLAIGTWALFGARDVGRLSIMDWTLWVIVAGCVQTIVVRLLHIFHDLDRGEATP
jgi:hypothetical protein